jgi:hypothetical protein
MHSSHAHCASNAQLSFCIEVIKGASCVQLLNHRKEKDLVKYVTYHATRPIPFDLTRVLLDDFVVPQLIKKSPDFHVFQMFPFSCPQNRATGSCLGHMSRVHILTPCFYSYCSYSKEEGHGSVSQNVTFYLQIRSAQTKFGQYLVILLKVFQ